MYKKNDRIVDITYTLLQNPLTVFPLSTFMKKYGVSRSSVSEDVDVVRKSFAKQGFGVVQNLSGPSGGVQFLPEIAEYRARQFISDVLAEINDNSRVLPGGFFFLSDLLGRPDILKMAGQLIATQYIDKKIDAVMTAATKGIPLAQSVANVLNVPFVIARSGKGKVTEGPTTSINYLTGSSKQVKRIELSRRSLQSGSRVLIVDDFLKAGGIAQGMQALIKEFGGVPVGVSVFADGRLGKNRRLVSKYTSLFHIETESDKAVIRKVSAGNYLSKIFKGTDKK